MQFILQHKEKKGKHFNQIFHCESLTFCCIIMQWYLILKIQFPHSFFKRSRKVLSKLLVWKSYHIYVSKEQVKTLLKYSKWSNVSS